ncbi:nitrate- and nitrite sensing domain-containing protein [Streptomyces sp. NPDC054775]
MVLVPCVTLVPLLGAGDYQLLTAWQKKKTEAGQAHDIAASATGLFISFEQERELTEETRADPGSDALEELAKQRAVTDRTVAAFRPLRTLNTAVWDTGSTRPGLTEAMARIEQGLDSLPRQRREVDIGSSGQDKAFLYYNGLLESIISVFGELAQDGTPEVVAGRETLVDLLTSVDMIGREGAVLVHGWKSGHLTSDEYGRVVDAMSTGQYLLLKRVGPSLGDKEADLFQAMTAGQAWRSRANLERRLIATRTDAGTNQVTLPSAGVEWRSSSDVITSQLLRIVQLEKDDVSRAAIKSADETFAVFVSVSGTGLLAVGLIVVASWRLTSVLRRRIRELREVAQELQQRLPDTIDRLGRGENIDLDAEVRLIEPTPDELGELAQALNLATRNAVSAAVRQDEQHRGFSRLLQRVARRTQILIGLQVRKLDELESRYEDPEVLEGLFDLDHLTARLRRYEESLVILAGGQPHRRWRKPARLLEVLRAAQGEVPDYRRISLDVQDEIWVTAGVVAPLVHILAELMENATAFSKPPTPVEVRAVAVSRGVVVEVEDRGIGMEPEQYAATNAFLETPPALDVLTHADDARLGLYVVARLAAAQGIRVELRPSAFGGTRAIILLPKALVAGRPATSPVPEAVSQEVAAARTSPQRFPHSPADVVVASAGSQERDDTPSLSGDQPHQPLPQRVRQASLVTELKALPPAAEETNGQAPQREQSNRSGATIGAFQRESRRARNAADALRRHAHAMSEASVPTTEDQA